MIPNIGHYFFYLLKQIFCKIGVHGNGTTGNKCNVNALLVAIVNEVDLNEAPLFRKNEDMDG